MKRWLSYLLAMLVLMCLPVFILEANAAETSGEWEYTLYEANAIISGYSGSASSVTVPGTIDGLKVVGIGNYVFQNHYNLVSVVLPESLESIGNYAFQNCTSLTAITLPEKLETVGHWAFYNCKALAKITVKSTKLKDFSSNANTFYNAGKEANGGVTVEFSEGVTCIPAYIFCCDGGYYARIKSVTIPSTVTVIGKAAFNNCYDLKNVTIAANSEMKTIGDYAFQNCTGLTAITLPENLETVGYHAFYNCKALSKITVNAAKLKDFSSSNNTFYNAGKEADGGVTVEFSEGATCIPAYMFSCDGEYYAQIKSVTIPSTITTIGRSAFINCYDLKNVTIAANSELEAIGDYAFQNCTGLTAITLPENLETVGYYAFYNCKALSKITVNAAKLKDFSSSKNTFYNAGKDVDGGITVTFSEGVTCIPVYMFSCDGEYYARIKSVTLPSTVTVIGKTAFNNCYDLKNVTIAANSELETIGDYAFQNCTSLTAITLPEKLETVGYYAFYNCKALSKITVNAAKLKDFSYSSNTFYNAGKEVDGGVTVEFSEDVTCIPAYMFSCASEYYARIKSVTISSTVTEVGNRAFDSCNDLSDVYYAGSKEEWNRITIGSYNEELTNATIHYNSVATKMQPGGYDFLEDSYSFENFSQLYISQKYFTTMYEEAAGKLLHKSQWDLGAGGVCFGMAYTTAAIYEGYPASTDFVTEHLLAEDESCENIRDLEKKSVVTIYNNEISLLDYIKYAHIYQLSSNVAKSSDKTWNDTKGLLAAVRESLANDTLGVTIGMTHCVRNDEGKWESDSGHRVLAIGIEGNDILIDDPNNTKGLERLTINNDGTWSYSAPWKADGVSSNNSLIRYQTDITMPYNILLTGNTVSVNQAFVDGAETSEGYVEGMQRLDTDKVLVYVDSESFEMDTANAYKVVADMASGTESALGGDLYWFDTSASVTVSEMSGSDNLVMFAGDDTLTCASIENQGNVTMSMVAGKTNVVMGGKEGEKCSVSFETTGSGEEAVVVTVTGILDGNIMTANHADTGIVVSGVAEGTVTLEHDDQLIYSEKISASDEVVLIDYDQDGEDQQIQITYGVQNPFTDVSVGEYYYAPVLWAVENGITNGMTETTFVPDGTCTRAQIVTFLWRANGSPVPTSSNNPFTDVPAGQWYTDAVLWAVEQGITTGTSATTFSPDAGCTRGQVATFLWRSEGEPASGGENIFTDIVPGAYYYDAVLWAVENGITNGMGDGTFAPDATCTRGQIVTFLYRYDAVREQQPDKEEGITQPDNEQESTQPTIPADKIKNLEIKQTYCLDDVIDAEKLGLTAVYESGKTEAITSGYVCSVTGFDAAGTQSITVSYGGITETFEVEVLDFYSLEVRVEKNSDTGYNEEGRVAWVLYVTARYNGNYAKLVFESSIVTDGAWTGDFVSAWNDAKNGKSAEWRYTCVDFGFGEYSGGGAFILPDDPSFAGQCTADITFGDVTKTAEFTLVYVGDYETGTGWSVADVNWT